MVIPEASSTPDKFQDNSGGGTSGIKTTKSANTKKIISGRVDGSKHVPAYYPNTRPIDVFNHNQDLHRSLNRYQSKQLTSLSKPALMMGGALEQSGPPPRVEPPTQLEKSCRGVSQERERSPKPSKEVSRDSRRSHKSSRAESQKTKRSRAQGRPSSKRDDRSRSSKRPDPRLTKELEVSPRNG